MALLKQPIQRKLSSLLGADVTFEKLNLSLLGGTVEASGVTVAPADKSLPPLLTIARLRAAVAVGRAFKGELVVKSLAVERPVLHFVRRDGRTNLPVRDDVPETAAVDEGAAPGEDGDTDNDDSGGSDDHGGSSWKFDVEKVLVVDGEVNFELDGRDFSAKPVLADLKRVDDGYELTLLAESVWQVGQVRCTGRITGAADLGQLPDAAIDAEVHVDEVARLKYTSPRIRSPEGQVEFSGAFTLAKLLSLLRPGG